MRFEGFTFGSIRIDGVTYEHDVVIDRGQVLKRKKKPSKKFSDEFGHTPLSVDEKIPWQCRRLVVGTGGGALPVMEDVKREAKRRRIELLILPTLQAIEVASPEAGKSARPRLRELLSSDPEVLRLASARLDTFIDWTAKLAERIS